MVNGAGILTGSLVMSAWGGPKRQILAVIGFITLTAVGLLITGLRPNVISIAAGLFILMFCMNLAAGPSQAIFQSKVAPAVQGRVFAIRSMISLSMIPLAFLLGKPLADRGFEPLMQTQGVLSQSIIGSILDVSPGRGIGLIFALLCEILYRGIIINGLMSLQ